MKLSTSTNTANRPLLGGRRRDVAWAFLLGLVTSSLISNNSYSNILAYIPSASIDSPHNEMNHTTMAEAMERPFDTKIIANETAHKKPVSLVKKQPNATDIIANGTALACNDTTVIITSNLIPISPSLAMINNTIQSLRHLLGLCPASPLIITVDGLNGGIYNTQKNVDERFAQYVQVLKETYNQDHHTIMAYNKSINLSNMVERAIRRVKTEFVYVLQHDMPFVQDINHAAILKTMHEYPDVLRLVRFNLLKNVRRKGEGIDTCWNETTPVNAINGIKLIKTWIWSDNNHLTRKSYYEEMFKMFKQKLGHNPRFMEWFMRGAGAQNCSHWGTFYYGRHGLPPTIGHLDGKNTQLKEKPVRR